MAKTLGYVNITMVLRTYGRSIPNLTRKAGSAFERQYADATKKESNPNGHNFGHNSITSECQEKELV